MNDRLALIADVADSRQIAGFPDRRDRLLGELSRRHRANGWTRFDYAVTAWDEFQGLIDQPSMLPRVVWDFWCAFRPWSLRLALGFGPVEPEVGADEGVPLNQAVTGEAFYLARAALEALDSPRHGMSRVRLRVGAPDDPRSMTCNAVLRLADALVQDITDRQWQIIERYEETGKQTEVAATLDVAESTVSRSLASARYWELKASLAELGELLSRSNATNVVQSGGESG
ncbi:SatD family protein [Wenzhouxiangella sp. EGI_FJ10305]|uniref:SatD family protein n=1 Tax=Wenzhouxiangella sp. EGI_FJ10305 TaxID=3243768 RepID=UPI0035E214E8